MTSPPKRFKGIEAPVGALKRDPQIHAPLNGVPPATSVRWDGWILGCCGCCCGYICWMILAVSDLWPPGMVSLYLPSSVYSR